MAAIDAMVSRREGTSWDSLRPYGTCWLDRGCSRGAKAPVVSLGEMKSHLMR